MIFGGLMLQRVHRNYSNQATIETNALSDSTVALTWIFSIASRFFKTIANRVPNFNQ